MDGVIVIDKPAGPTSHDVVAVVRRAIKSPRVGHTGTLDPLATGVLPLVVGQATRLASFMSGADKEYVAQIRFGSATRTYDAEPEQGIEPAGDRAAHAAAVAALTERDILETLPAFAGRYMQTPPVFSAKKVGGKPAYKLARAGKPVDLTPVEVHVSALSLETYSDGLAQVRLTCSSGFYVRSLAHDLGQRLGCGAHLEGLRRTRSGTFSLDGAVTLDAVVQEGAAAAERGLVPMSRLVAHLPAVTTTEEGARRVGHGSALRPVDLVRRSGADTVVPGTETASRWRLFDGSGALLGLAEPRADGLLHPVLVLV
jgi:tRNA pseudouridine55 synthase